MPITEEEIVEMLQKGYEFGNVIREAKGDPLTPEYLEARERFLDGESKYGSTSFVHYFVSKPEEISQAKDFEGYMFWDFLFLGHRYYVSFFSPDPGTRANYRTYLDNLVVLNSMKCGIKTYASVYLKGSILTVLEEDYTKFTKQFSFLPKKDVFEGQLIRPKHLYAYWMETPEQPRFLVHEVSLTANGLTSFETRDVTGRRSIPMTYDEYVVWINGGGNPI